ncbi:MAG: DUF4956 domain-containing protein [Eubacterium sp.]
MLDSILLESGSTTASLDLVTALICSVASICLGLVIACVYMFCGKKYSKNFVVTLVILPILVQAVIMMVNGNLGTSVAILGAFSLVRFRSIPGTAKEICTIFFAMAVGLATGMGYIGFAAIITAIVSLVMIVLSLTRFGNKNSSSKMLKIVIPENLDYGNEFDDIFKKYTKKAELERVKTTNLGSMFDLTYEITLKENISEKEMIDELRTKNGNLSISLNRMETPIEEL